ncbi:MAG: hypothetical protein KDE19_15615 [Caldilineaceae bacterium]|nr:hypothetical protein [Caldilineaceae bacterium]
MVPLPTGLNLILFTLVIVASAITILQTYRDPVTNSPRWIPISAGLIGFSLLVLLIVPTAAGYLSAGAWLLLAIVPSLGFYLSNHLHYRGQYMRAWQIKRWLRWLHPLQDWPWQEALFQANIDLQAGHRDRAVTVLQRALETLDVTPEREVLIFVMSHDWHGLIAWWETHPVPSQLEARPDVIRHYIRALGETGSLDAMVETFLHYRPILERVPVMLNYAYLYLFAFGGQVDALNRLLNTRLSETLNPDLQVIWIATAHAAADHLEMSKALLRPILRTTQNGLTKFTIEQRLGRDLCLATSTLSTEAQTALAASIQEWTDRNQTLTTWH